MQTLTTLHIWEKNENNIAQQITTKHPINQVKWNIYSQHIWFESDILRNVKFGHSKSRQISSDILEVSFFSQL